MTQIGEQIDDSLVADSGDIGPRRNGGTQRRTRRGNAPGIGQ